MGTDASIDFGARISGATTDIASRVTGAIRDAARITGAGFEYLLNTAVRESNLNPEARSPNSSATGLFQFLDQTWLATLKEAGPGLGYGSYADSISKTSSGRYVVSDPAKLREIMALRKDPTANAVMAGAFANANAKTLTDRLGRKPTDGELYIAHFLGASGAVRLISAAQTQPNTPAASLFPKAAAANTPIFYDRKTGAARSLSQVYAVLTARHDPGGATRFANAPSPPAGITTAALAAPTATTAASATTVQTAAPVPASRPLVAAVDPALLSPTTVYPQAAQATQTTTSAPMPQHQQNGPMFYGLYQEGNRGAVAPVVRELWGVRHGMPVETVAVAPTVTPVTPAAPAKPPLDLFHFLRPDARKSA